MYDLFLPEVLQNCSHTNIIVQKQKQMPVRTRRRLKKMDQHWRPYNALCAFCSFNYTVISKTETFDEDEMRIMEMFGLTGRNQSKLNTNAGDKIQNITKQCFESIAQEEKTALVDLYKYDFAMFGYDPQDYVQ